MLFQHVPILSNVLCAHFMQTGIGRKGSLTGLDHWNNMKVSKTIFILG